MDACSDRTAVVVRGIFAVQTQNKGRERERERNIDSDKKLWQEFLYVHFIQVTSSFFVFKNNWLLLDGWTNGPTDG